MIYVITMPSADHQVYSHEAPDGTLRAWDVTLGHELAVRNGRTLQPLFLAQYGVTEEKIRKFYPDVDEAYALTTDLTKPLLAIPFFGDLLLIDGWHRLMKAVRLNVIALWMYCLTEAEAESIKWMEVGPGAVRRSPSDAVSDAFLRTK